MALGSYKTGSGLRISALLARYGDAKVAPALGAALYREAEGILAQSVELCPVDTGALRASRYATPPQRDGDTITVTIGYGGPAGGSGEMEGLAIDDAILFGTARAKDPAVYAIYVHENLEAHHPVGSAKYLEIPFQTAKRGMTARIAADMRAELSGVGGGWQAPADGGTIALTPKGQIARKPRK